MNQLTQIANILAASRQIDPVFLNSPTASDDALNAALGCHVVAKIETANPIGSFKGRGTELFCATALRAGESMVCASAGNFGQGLARAATKRGSPCHVFAAQTANPLKVEAMRRFGAIVHLVGHDFDQAKHAAREYANEHGMRFVEDGVEPAIAEGAGTIAIELASAQPFETMLVPLGNGALLAGVGTALRHIAPHVDIIAVVAAAAPAMKLSLEAGQAIETESANTIADGIAVRVPIADSLAHLRACCDAVVAVSEADIFKAMQLVHRHLDLVLEPAGAVGIAAILAEPGRFADRRVATILCGGNISVELRHRLLAA
ncbi:threonine ammonia-lyase [Dyella silvatica]|uniref:threonine ammonia-lyase n=1 Tax=Dyella silvatica TaxID=2992128 RepID=UPI002254721C|nr:pyridoxal-phosphate dependent enzyme [Dyella silvatica]